MKKEEELEKVRLEELKKEEELEEKEKLRKNEEYNKRLQKKLNGAQSDNVSKNKSCIIS